MVSLLAFSNINQNIYLSFFSSFVFCFVLYLLNSLIQH